VECGMATTGNGDTVTEAGPGQTCSGPSSPAEIEIVTPAAPVEEGVVTIINHGNSSSGDVANEPTQVVEENPDSTEEAGGTTLQPKLVRFPSAE